MIRFVHAVCFVFFVQAEDGIRDLVRSRGLGDVYKRQAIDGQDAPVRSHGQPGHVVVVAVEAVVQLEGRGSVSYTHLTLPTSDLV